MKSKNLLKIVLSLILFGAFCFVSFETFARPATKFSIPKEDNVKITIDKKTTEESFLEIKKMLKEHRIEVSFTQVKRNKEGELTALKIVLEDGKRGNAESEISSNLPISQITFGRKDGLLFISEGNGEMNLMNFMHSGNGMNFGFSNDSLTAQDFNFFGNNNSFFNNNADSSFFNSKGVNIDEIRKQMEQFFKQSEGAISNGSYKFFDDPKTNKLIIIDGKESDFKTLDELAKENKIDDVASLKSKIAMSIYGEKAKDGALIVTTK
ncbi:hypothetical protein RCH33_1445 [Flavobacterium daejeonense]|nr:hypothetical protein RCH33_1445 [Flavobacterium daejeonense]